MKVSILGALAALSPLAALAAPLTTRAAAAEGPIGYASQNGGTTGGAGGSSLHPHRTLRREAGHPQGHAVAEQGVAGRGERPWRGRTGLTGARAGSRAVETGWSREGRRLRSRLGSELWSVPHRSPSDSSKVAALG